MWWKWTIPILIAAAILTAHFTLSGKWNFRPRIALPAGGHLQLTQVAESDAASSSIVFRESFPLTNRGTAPLNFKIEKSCSCSSVAPQTGTIAAGETIPIMVTMQLDSPGTRTAELYIHSNDALLPKVLINLAAERLLPLNAIPGRIDFGDIAVGTQHSRTIEIKHRADTLRGLGLYQISANNTHLECDLKGDGDKPDTYLLEIAVGSKSPEGRLDGLVHLQSSDMDYVLSIPVTAFVVPEIDVAPRTVIVRKRPGSEEIVPTKLVFTAAPGVSLGKLQAWQLPPGLRLVELDSSHEQQRHVELTGFVEEAELQSECEVHFAGTNKAITFAVILNIDN